VVYDSGVVMASDFRVRRRSNEELQKIAASSRHHFGVDTQNAVDVVTCLSSGWVNTVAGKKRLVIELSAEMETGVEDAVTKVEASLITMRFKQSVWRAASKLPVTPEDWTAHYRARFTLAHELGHAVLNHDRAPMARGTGVNVLTRMPSFIEKAESAEHQANEFASNFLIGLELARECTSAHAIVHLFSVSVSAATLFFEKHLKSKKSKTVVDGFERLMASLNAVPVKCETCGTIFPPGADKEPCRNCHAILGALPDGDSANNPAMDRS
jgi:hypothetical protein